MAPPNQMSALPAPSFASVADRLSHPPLRSASSRYLSGSLDRAFSLVEIVLAIGICSFALLAMLGTMPIGLKSLQDSAARTVSSNIVRGMSAEFRQRDFSTLTTSTASNGGTLWFDAEGFPAQSDPVRQVFATVVTVSDPGTVSSPSDEAIRFPGGDGGEKPPNALVKNVGISIFRSAPLATRANLVGTGRFFVGDNGR